MHSLRMHVRNVPAENSFRLLVPRRGRIDRYYSRVSVNFNFIGKYHAVADSVVNSAEKVEGPGTRGTKESVNDSKDEDGSDVTSTLSGLLAGLPTLAGPQRFANSLRQKFASNSGESNFAATSSNTRQSLVDIFHDVVNPWYRSRRIVDESHDFTDARRVEYNNCRVECSINFDNNLHGCITELELHSTLLKCTVIRTILEQNKANYRQIFNSDYTIDKSLEKLTSALDKFFLQITARDIVLILFSTTLNV